MNHYLILPQEVPALAERVGRLAEITHEWRNVMPRPTEPQGTDTIWLDMCAKLTYDGAFDNLGRRDKPIVHHQHKMQLRIEAQVKGTMYGDEVYRVSWDMSEAGGADEPDEVQLLALWHHVRSTASVERGQPQPLILSIAKQRHYDFTRHPKEQPNVWLRGSEEVVVPYRMVENGKRNDPWDPPLFPVPLVGPPPGEGWELGPIGYTRAQQRLWERRFGDAVEGG